MKENDMPKELLELARRRGLNPLTYPDVASLLQALTPSPELPPVAEELLSVTTHVLAEMDRRILGEVGEGGGGKTFEK
jgi:hypothetical protein